MRKVLWVNKIFDFINKFRPRERNPRNRVFVIGVPHLDWKLVKLMEKEGRLENLNKLIKDGSYGEVVPQETVCSTPIEFTSAVTGVKKEEHSIGYGKHSDGEYIEGGRLYTRLDIKAKPIWDIALKHKKRVGIYQWLLTWPPKKINGFMVTGRTSQDENKTYPKELKDILWFDYPPEPDYFDPDAVMMLLKIYDVDLFLGMEERTHGPIHILWECVEPGKTKDQKRLKEMRKELFGYFKYLDKFLGKVQEEFPNATVMIVSDSGNRSREYPIYTLGNETIELSKKLNIDLQFYATDIYPPHLPKAKPTFHLPKKSQEEKERIGNILSKITYKNGERFIKDIVWKGDNLSFSFNFHPSFIDDKCNWINLVLPNDEDFKIWVIRQTGASHPNGGVFIVKGPLIKENYDVGKVDVLDIAPTILFLLGLPIPENMEGRFLSEMIKE